MGGYRFPRIGASLVDPLLNRTIVIADGDVADRLDSILTRDILPALAEMTGFAFSVVSSSGLTGVVRVSVNGALAKQRYTIDATQTGDVLIKGGNWRGCKDGIYAWLAELGVCQLAPGRRFRVVPGRSDLRLSLAIDRTSAMGTIAWQAQGSGVTDPFLDTSAQRDAWYAFLDWNGRPLANYTTASIPAYKQPSGPHYDASVYTNKQSDFDADPEHFAQPFRSWHATTLYYPGDLVTNGANRYICTQKGISAGSGGPTGTGTNITDGAAKWNFDVAGAREVGKANFHHTHGGAGGPDDPSDYTCSDPASVVAIYAAERLGVSTGLRYELAHAGDDPDNADLFLNLSTAVNDGNENCKDAKCLALLRHFSWSSLDASATDTSLWRAGKIYDALHAAEPAAQFEILDLAYDRQSAPPTTGLPVSPGLRILLAQNLFNYDAYPSTSLLERWAARRDLDGFKLGLYDYWALPAHDLAAARYPASTAWRYFRQWIDAGIDFFNGETTTGIGSIGLHWWGALKMNWHGGDVADEDLFEEWSSKAFGAASVHVKRMLERWWATEWPRPIFHAFELGLAFEDLRLADAAVLSDAPARARVAAMMTYVVWLHYRTAWFALTQDDPAAAPSEADSDAIAGPLLQHVWSSRDTFMIDASWVHAGIASDARFLSDAFIADWTIPSDSALWAAWRADRGISLYTDDEIRTKFETVRALYPTPSPASFTAPDLTSLIAPFTPSISTAEASAFMAGSDGPPMGHEYIFEKKTGATGVITLEVAGAILPGSVVVSVYNAETGALVSTEEIDFVTRWIDDFDAAKITRTYSLGSMAVGFYRLIVENNRGGGWHRITHQYDIAIVRVGTYDRPAFAGNVSRPPLGSSGYYPQYFFVPTRVARFHFYIPVWTADGQTKFIIRDGDDAIVTPTQLADRPRIYRVTVPVGQDQKGWRVESPYENNGALRLLDLPPWFAPSREQLIIPANLYGES